ncbi:hypothetical protein ACJMK2_029875 [Sinanodonta woodiana]|uniref:Uncharacterized protein n=1 Tax=Sinanodonta woodiana TaxID=1069815 RepID=A0ABD3XC36_SINWO
MFDCIATYYQLCVICSYLAPVYDDCACGKNGSMTRPGSALPPWCLSPSGADCGWYRQCLEKQFPCEGTPVAYAITYAEKFCNLYTDHASNFSQIGQRWINAVRKCLQVELVPNLRSWANTSCEKIRRNAFDSHAKCYLSPTNGEPSICELPCQDYIQVICTVKSAFLSAKVEAIKGLIEAYRGCKKFDCLKLPNLALFVFKTFRERFSLQKSPTMEELDELAGAVADAIASKLGWRDSGVLWYAQSNYTNLTSIVSVEVLITGKGIYDLGSTKASNFNITAVTAKVVKAVKDGDLFLGKVGDQSEPMYVKQMKECADFECQRATQEITAPPNRFTSSAYDLRNNFMHTFLTLSFLSSLSYNFPNAYIP